MPLMNLTWRDYSIRKKTRVAVLAPVTVLLLSCCLFGWLRSQATAPLTSAAILGTFLVGVIGTFVGTSVLAKNISERTSQLLESSILIAEGVQVKSLDSSKDELGKLAGMLAHTSHVLAERAGEIAELNWKLESVLRAATSVSIVSEDNAGRITLFNTGATKLLGYRADEVMGRSLSSIVKETTPESQDSHASVQNYETTYIRKDGVHLEVQVSVTPLKDISGRSVGRLHVAQDITPRKLLEAELRSKMKPLRSLQPASGNSPATADSEESRVKLPDYVRSDKSNEAATLASTLDAINNWYESQGHIPDSAEDQSSELPKVLIVDDFDATRALLRAYLQEEGYQLDFAANGKGALEKVANRRYDLILMDVEMPEMDGYEAAERIRDWEQMQGRKSTPIVALSAHSSADIDDDRRAVWTSYLTKPLSKNQLLEQVGLYLKPKKPASVRS